MLTCECAKYSAGVAFETDPSPNDVFLCDSDGHLPAPPNFRAFYACRRCRRLYNAEGQMSGFRLGLAQRFEGAVEVELDHAAELFYAWYGGTEIMGWNADGSLHHSFELEFWSLDQLELKARVHALLRSMNTDPEAFHRMHKRVLGLREKESCDLEQIEPAQPQRSAA